MSTSARKLGYLDFEILIQDIFDRPMMIDVCDRFLTQQITDDARLYARAKLSLQQAILGGETRLSELMVQTDIYRDLTEAARRSGDVLLESLCLTKVKCDESRMRLVPAAAKFRDLHVTASQAGSYEKIGGFSTALVLALGARREAASSALVQSRSAALGLDEQMMVTYVAAAVGVANELSRDDLDKGYELLATVNRCAPGCMYPHLYALCNRLTTFVYRADTGALNEAKALLDHVEHLSESWPAEGTLRPVLTPDMAVFMDDVRRKNRELIKQFVREISEAIRPDTERSDLAAVLRRRIQSSRKDAFDVFLVPTHEPWLDRYQAIAGA